MSGTCSACVWAWLLAPGGASMINMVLAQTHPPKQPLNVAFARAAAASAVLLGHPGTCTPVLANTTHWNGTGRGSKEGSLLPLVLGTSHPIRGNILYSL